MCKKIIAISGPSCAGKTTLTKKMSTDYGFTIPRHTTTRNPRQDDEVGFYRYVSFEKFKQSMENKEFLIASCDEIKGYGILKSDCEDAWCFSDTIILNVSYKDTERLMELQYDVKIIILTFKDIIQSMMSRILSRNRLHSLNDIQYRIESAKKDSDKYFSALEKYATAIAYTDTMDEIETYNFVREKLKLNKIPKISQCKTIAEEK